MHRATRILPFALTAAALAACGSNSSGPAAGFECLGQALPTTAPATIAVTGQVRQNALAPTALRGAYVFAFPTVGTDTLAADTSDTPGFYSLSITTGGTPVNGYVRATDSAHITTYAYPAVPLAANATENILMVTTGGGRRIHRSRRDELHRHATRGGDGVEHPCRPGALQRGRRAELDGDIHGG